jgi:hypothetical protein
MVIHIYEAAMEHNDSRNYTGIELVPLYSYVGVGLSHETGMRENIHNSNKQNIGALRRELCSSAKMITVIMSVRMTKGGHEAWMGQMINA